MCSQMVKHVCVVFLIKCIKPNCVHVRLPPGVETRVETRGPPLLEFELTKLRPKESPRLILHCNLQANEQLLVLQLEA